MCNLHTSSYNHSVLCAGLLTALREYSRGKEVEPEVDDHAPVYQVPIVIPGMSVHLALH